MSNRQDKDREAELQPQRIEYVCQELSKRGFEFVADETTVVFQYKGSKITVYPYSGWFTGKTVNDNRGVEKLFKQLDK